ncbi:hypothetical protein AB0F17_34270 [Nonomuraea sp. NPDC026600]|uniref:hypothetical protein n=1 Tax=Nonomuraea sp. NPDC026600 TaxID=3155363 RepID=UPI003409373C
MAFRSFFISLTLALAALAAARYLPDLATSGGTDGGTAAMAAATFSRAVVPVVLLTFAAAAALFGIAATLDPTSHRNRRRA